MTMATSYDPQLAIPISQVRCTQVERSQSEVAVFLLQTLHLLAHGALLPVFWGVALVLAVVAAAKRQFEGHSVQFELLREVSHQESFVVACEEMLGVHEANEMRGSDSGLNHVVYSEGVVLIFGEGLQLLEILQPIIEHTSRYPHIPLVVGRHDPIQHLIDARAEFSTDEHQGITMYLSQTLLNLFQQIVLRFVSIRILHGFPLVHHYHNWSPLLDDLPNQREIIDHEGIEGVHHVDHHMALLDMSHSTDLHFSQVLLAVRCEIGRVEPSSVDHLDLPAFVFDAGTNCIAGCVSDIRHHHLVLPQNLVYQSGFADVGTTDKADTDGPFQSQVAGLGSSLVGVSFLRSDQPIFEILVVQILIFLRIGVDFTEVALPFLDSELLRSVISFHFGLQLLHQCFKPLESEFAFSLELILHVLRNLRVDILEYFNNP